MRTVYGKSSGIARFRRRCLPGTGSAQGEEKAAGTARRADRIILCAEFFQKTQSFPAIFHGLQKQSVFYAFTVFFVGIFRRRKDRYA
jgi:hypothetical protein